MTTKPAHVRLREGSLKDTDFSTPGQREAARAILQHWEDTHNFTEIARRTGWSKSHIRNVFDEYFESAESPPEPEAEGFRNRALEELPDDILEAYRKGYRDGFKDGLKNTQN